MDSDRYSRWVGIAAITVYAPTIFAEAGYAARKSQWLSGLNDVRVLCMDAQRVFSSLSLRYS